MVITKTVTATDAKNHFGEMLRNAYAQSEHTIIERDGIPVAVLVPIQDYVRLLNDQLEPDTTPGYLTASIQAADARVRLRAFLAETHQRMPTISEDEVEEDIQNAVEAVRRPS